MLSQAAIRQAWSPPCRGPWVRIRLHGAGAVSVRPAIYHAVIALNACLRQYNYRTRAHDTGAYVCRRTTNSSSYSLHAYGIAIDINWQSNPYGRRLITDMPRAMVNAICGIRTNNGKQVWNWGGFWSGNKDAMHYEIVCSPRDLATGIRQSTVPSGVTLPQPPPPAPKPAPKPTPPPEPEDEDVAYYHTPPDMGGNGEVWLVDAWNYKHLSKEEWEARKSEPGVKLKKVHILHILHMAKTRRPWSPERYVRTPPNLGGKGEVYLISEHYYQHLTPQQWRDREAEGAVAEDLHVLHILHMAKTRTRWVGPPVEYLQDNESKAIFAVGPTHFRRLSGEEWKKRQEEGAVASPVHPLVIYHRALSRVELKD